MEFITTGASETQELAGKIIRDLVRRPAKGALVLALQGELGAGKTTFIQGLARALGVKEKVLSPTFVIMKHYDIKTFRLAPLAQGIKKIYHIDVYRLESAKDLAGLGLEEILKDKKNLVVIEWAERVRDLLPKDAVWMKFEHGREDRRKIISIFPEQGA